MNQNKIINDPVHGFIEIPKGMILNLIDTPEYQRLRRIKQLALSSLVYPGAVHSRFNHCIGAMHLTRQALLTLRDKGIEISEEEFDATLIAILMHDVGHGPFSHALESVILQGLHHERMSRAIMLNLNERFDSKLVRAIAIFEGAYPRKFLHQLVSSQLDMDRMDYLKRDSYFTGVVEGLVSADRIIKTLNVADDRIVVESKGIYSVEKFLVARRLMYWQVYLHKAVLSAEHMIVRILRRARELRRAGEKVWLNEELTFFFDLESHSEITDEIMQHYTRLDDEDIMYAVKQWQKSTDPVLSRLCRNLLGRKLFKVRIETQAVPAEAVAEKRALVMQKWGLSEAESKYFVFTGEVSNAAYLRNTDEPIEILFKNGSIHDIAEASDIHNIETLSQPVVKHFLCFPEI